MEYFCSLEKRGSLWVLWPAPRVCGVWWLGHSFNCRLLGSLVLLAFFFSFCFSGRFRCSLFLVGAPAPWHRGVPAGNAPPRRGSQEPGSPTARRLGGGEPRRLFILSAPLWGPRATGASGGGRQGRKRGVG